MVNKVILIGNLGRDPEMRSFPSGDSVCEFSLATTYKWKNRTTGELQSDTEWHNIKVSGRQAEIAGQYLRKGKQVYIEGRIRTRSWDDKQTGEKKYRTEIICQRFQMLGSKGDSGGDYGAGAPRPEPPQGPQGGDFSGPSDDDIPF